MALLYDVSRLNSTTTPLAAGETFTGDWEPCANWASINVTGVTDVAATLYCDFSPDGVNADRAVQLSDGNDGALGIHGLIPVLEYFRVRVVNGASNQTYIRVQTTLHLMGRIAQPTSRLGQNVGQYSDVQNVRVANDQTLDTARGVIGGRSTINKFGNHTAVGTTEVVITSVDTTFAGFLTAASAVRIKAGGNAADDAGGLGAQTVLVEGLDENWELAQETVTLAGASASSPTSTTFIRVFRGWVATSGTYGNGVTGGNTGNVDIETTGGVLLMRIRAGQGQSAHAAYTVPAGKTGYLTRVEANIEGTGSATGTVRLWQRQNADTVTAPYTSRRLIHNHAFVSGRTDQKFSEYIQLPAKTDIWVTALKDSMGTIEVDAEFALILVDN